MFLGESLSLVPCFFQGISVSSPMFLRGSLSLFSCSFQGVSLTETPLDRGILDRDPRTETPRTAPSFMVKSGRYASYWNVFLFKRNIANFSETPALYENFTRRIEIPWRTRIFKASHGLKVHNVPVSYQVLQQPLELKFYSEKWIIHFQGLHTPNPTDKLIKIYYF